MKKKKTFSHHCDVLFVSWNKKWISCFRKDCFIIISVCRERYVWRKKLYTFSWCIPFPVLFEKEISSYASSLKVCYFYSEYTLVSERYSKQGLMFKNININLCLWKGKENAYHISENDNCIFYIFTRFIVNNLYFVLYMCKKICWYLNKIRILRCPTTPHTIFKSLHPQVAIL